MFMHGNIIYAYMHVIAINLQPRLTQDPKNCLSDDPGGWQRTTLLSAN